MNAHRATGRSAARISFAYVKREKQDLALGSECHTLLLPSWQSSLTRTYLCRLFRLSLSLCGTLFYLSHERASMDYGIDRGASSSFFFSFFYQDIFIFSPGSCLLLFSSSCGKRCFDMDFPQRFPNNNAYIYNISPGCDNSPFMIASFIL